MNDAETLKALEAIDGGDVGWDTHGSSPGISFTIGAHVDYAVHSTMRKLSERLYEREGMRDGAEYGRVRLSLEGQRLLSELRGEPPRKSVWSRS